MAGVALVGLFFWSTWQTQRLDALYRERVGLERNLEYERLHFREVEAQWYEQTSPDRVLSRARDELALVSEDANGRSLVTLPDDQDLGARVSWLSAFAQRLDRFGELSDAYAKDEPR